MDIDTLIYAVIAIVLLGRLWYVLGRRSDDDPQRPNPFIMPAPDSADEAEGNAALTDPAKKAPSLPPPPVIIAPDSLAGHIEQVRSIDAAFDERIFLQEARALFTTVVESFAKGDLTSIADRLGPHVLPPFQQAIDQRQKAGETLESRVARIRDIETVDARTEGTSAFLKVRIVSEQENILRDSAGGILSGAPGRLEEITDLWTFSRDTSSVPSAWIVAETHS